MRRCILPLNLYIKVHRILMENINAMLLYLAPPSTLLLRPIPSIAFLSGVVHVPFLKGRAQFPGH
jgi:hypothetical protein